MKLILNMDVFMNIGTKRQSHHYYIVEVKIFRRS